MLISCNMWNGTEKVFLVGICGISLSALAFILKGQGHEVCGSDHEPNEMKEKLESRGIKVFCSHDAKNIEGMDVVVFTAAAKENNPEIVEAKRQGKKVLTRAQLLGELSKSFAHTIAISGTHGKTTTTAMIASILIDAGFDPTVHIGGNFCKIGGNVRVGRNNFFVTEACEYCDSFLSLFPEVGVVLNVQADHLDYFKNIGRIERSFAKFAVQTQKLFVFSDEDKRAKKIAQNLNIQTNNYSIDGNSGIVAKNLMATKNGCFSFQVFQNDKFLGRIFLSVPGKHNVKNALAAICVALFFDVDFETIADSLAEFTGVDRRFELVGKIGLATAYHDYAHHPSEIKASIESARMIKNGKLFVVFQPHTFSRTKSFFGAFAKELTKADETIMFPIYPAREDPIEGVTSDALSKQICQLGGKSICLHTYSEVLEYLCTKTKKEDLVLILGAGDIVGITKLI